MSTARKQTHFFFSNVFLNNQPYISCAHHAGRVRPAISQNAIASVLIFFICLRNYYNSIRTVIIALKIIMLIALNHVDRRHKGCVLCSSRVHDPGRTWPSNPSAKNAFVCCIKYSTTNGWVYVNCFYSLLFVYFYFFKIPQNIVHRAIKIKIIVQRKYSMQTKI